MFTRRVTFHSKADPSASSRAPSDATSSTCFGIFGRINQTEEFRITS